MMRTARRHTLVALPLALAILVPSGAAAAAATRAPGGAVAPSQELVQLMKAQPVFSEAGGGHRLKKIGAHGPLTGEQRVLPVLDTQTAGTPAATWLQVALPGRPNEHSGWIKKTKKIKLGSTPWHIVVSTEDRTVALYNSGRRVRKFSAVVGKASTPTPHGEFFIEETVALGPSDPVAPFALALSAYSTVLQEFGGGPGQIAIHGLQNIGGTPGTAVSHGCIRLSTRNIRYLASRVDPGVPVTLE